MLCPIVTNLPENGKLTVAFRGATSGGHIRVYSEASPPTRRAMATCCLDGAVRNVTCDFERALKNVSKDGLMFRYEPPKDLFPNAVRRARQAWAKHVLDVPQEEPGVHDGVVLSGIDAIEIDWWSLAL